MVSLAFVLFTVSTLATLINALPKDLPVRHLCGDETLCNIEPSEYPQEEIDRMVLENLPQLRRTKRQAVVPEMPEEVGNCEVIHGEAKSPFSMSNNQNVPEYLLHSEWFTQTFPQTKCKSDDWQPDDNSLEKSCFSEFLSSKATKTSCKTKTVYITVFFKDSVSLQSKTGNATIDIDCACVITED